MPPPFCQHEPRRGGNSSSVASEALQVWSRLCQQSLLLPTQALRYLRRLIYECLPPDLRDRRLPLTPSRLPVEVCGRSSAVRD